ncbi:hypothetical protein [Geothrix sp. PMB-07]|nr:hypothetical protein [Geothrix sp. PMB-07]WLT32771.1 hypothetical protein Q9293_05415 [Geothrix sp. PMB-07]
MKRFEAWKNERLGSTAPVVSWPPDEIDYFGNRDTKSRATRRKG